MKVSRSGFYKWLKNKDILNNYEINRNDMCDLVKEYHKKHPSWGYRHINRQIRVDIGWYVSDNFVHKCCKFLGIKSVVRNYKYRKPGEESIKYPNLVKGNWNVEKPLELIVSNIPTSITSRMHTRCNRKWCRYSCFLWNRIVCIIICDKYDKTFINLF